LSSSSAALRGRRASSRQTTTDADEEADALGRSHRSESSQSSQSSDTTFYSAQTAAPHAELEPQHGAVAAATYEARSAAAVAEAKAQLRAALDDLPFAAPSQEQRALQASYLE